MAGVADVKLPKYEDVKAHKGMAGWIPGIGRKIDRANAKIKDALNTTNPQIQESNDNKNVQYEIATDKDEEAGDGESEGAGSRAEGDVADSQGTDAQATAQIIVGSSDAVLGSAAVNAAMFEEMNANCEPGKEAIMAELTAGFETINAAIVMLSANSNEAAALAAELEALMDEQEAGGAGGAAGSYGSSIEAGTYSLGTPGDNPTPPVGSRQGGGAITAGSTPVGSGNNNGNAVGGSGGSDRSAEILAKYQRFNEINEQNTQLSVVIEEQTAVCEELQIAYTSDVETQMAQTEEGNQQSEAGVRDANNFENVCQGVIDVGEVVSDVGGVMDATGTGLRIVGGGIKGAGNVMKGVGGMLSGVSGVLGSLGLGLLGSVFTSVAGTAVMGSSKATKGASVAVKATGTGVFGTGVSIDEIGVGLKAAGGATKAIGDGAKTLGSAGLTASYAVHGEWDRALTAGMQFLGSAVSCLGDTAAFCENMKALGEVKNEFIASVQEFAGKIDQKMTKFLGGGDKANPDKTTVGTDDSGTIRNFDSKGVDTQFDGKTGMNGGFGFAGGYDADAKGNVFTYTGLTDVTGGLAGDADKITNAASGYLKDQGVDTTGANGANGTGGTTDTSQKLPEFTAQQKKLMAVLGLDYEEFRGKTSAQVDARIDSFAKSGGFSGGINDPELLAKIK